MAWNRVMAFQTKVSGTWGTWNSIAQNSKIPSGNFAKVNSVVPVKVIDGYVFIGEIPFLNADKYNIAVISIATVTGGSKATFSFNINKTPFGFNAYTNNTDAIYWVSTYLKEGMGAVDFTANYKG